MKIFVAHMRMSPFNHSIWQGFYNACLEMEIDVAHFETKDVPHPGQLKNRPDLLLVVHGSSVPLSLIDTYRDFKIPTVVQLVDEPYEVDRAEGWSPHYDWVLSNDRSSVSVHNHHTKAMFSPLAYDSLTFHPEGNSYPSEILMLGSPLEIRKTFLEPLLDEWGDRITWVGRGWKAWVGRRGSIVDSHFGSFNSRKLPATHCNPRTWEAAACKTIQVCTDRDDMRTYLPSLPVFTSSKQLGELFSFYLREDEEREKLAERLYSQVKEHSYTTRLKQFLTVAVPSFESSVHNS
jgi:spore maturation protein CgeB